MKGATPSKIFSLRNLRFLAASGVAFAAFAFLLHFAFADELKNVSDTVSNSAPGAVATHVISYNNTTSTLAGQTIKLIFDPATDGFDGIQNIVFGDLQFTGATLISDIGSCTGPTNDEVYFTSTSTAPGDESIVFTVCAGDSLPTGTKSIVISNRIVNPTITGSYVISITGTQADSQLARIAIIENVIVTAAVDTNFTFTILGVSSSIVVHPAGVTTTLDSTPTALSFGTLSINTPVTVAQRLSVMTNAAGGFTVAVQENQNLLSLDGSDIDLFLDGAATATPVPWSAPAGIPDQEDTFGHLGITSNDGNLNGGEFGSSTALFAGNFNPTSSRVVFSHTGPSDGTTQDKGLATVSYRVEIGVMQEPGSDYTNTLTYVATPRF